MRSTASTWRRRTASCCKDSRARTTSLSPSVCWQAFTNWARSLAVLFWASKAFLMSGASRLNNCVSRSSSSAVSLASAVGLAAGDTGIAAAGSEMPSASDASSSTSWPSTLSATLRIGAPFSLSQACSFLPSPLSRRSSSTSTRVSRRASSTSVTPQVAILSPVSSRRAWPVTCLHGWHEGSGGGPLGACPAPPRISSAGGAIAPMRPSGRQCPWRCIGRRQRGELG